MLTIQLKKDINQLLLYISAQPTELQVFTINDSEGEMADYLILNDSLKRARSVSPEVKQYQFFEKENKPNAMKCNFKTNKVLTAIRESGHTITTSEGKIVHEKLAFNPIKFQLFKKPDEQRKPTSRCRRCGKFSQGEDCDTHKRVFGLKDKPQETSHSHTLPMMPQGEPKNCDPETGYTDEEDSDAQTTPKRLYQTEGKHPLPEKCKPLQNRQPQTKRHYRPCTVHTRQGFNPDPGDQNIRPGSHKGQGKR